MRIESAIRLISQIALETASDEKQLIVYDAMSACLPTVEERSVAASITRALRESDRLRNEFLQTQSDLFGCLEDAEAA